MTNNGISPWRVGQLLPVWTIPITDETGKVVDLTGVANNQFSLTIYDKATGLARAGDPTGAFTVQSPATAGVVTYAWGALDVATPGHYTLTVAWTVGGKPDDSGPIDWDLKPVGAP